MPSTPDLFVIALQLRIEMGPRARIPVAQRLQEAAPQSSQAAREEALTLAKQATHFAWQLAEQMNAGALSDDEALKAIQARYPELGEHLAVRLRNYGGYVAK